MKVMDALLRSAKRGAYAGLAQLVRASALQAGGHWFESSTPHHVAVVQLVEHQIVALVVVDSSSTGHPIKKADTANHFIIKRLYRV